MSLAILERWVLTVVFLMLNPPGVGIGSTPQELLVKMNPLLVFLPFQCHAKEDAAKKHKQKKDCRYQDKVHDTLLFGFGFGNNSHVIPGPVESAHVGRLPRAAATLPVTGTG